MHRITWYVNMNLAWSQIRYWIHQQCTASTKETVGNLKWILPSRAFFEKWIAGESSKEMLAISEPGRLTSFSGRGYRIFAFDLVETWDGLDDGVVEAKEQ